MSKFVQHGKISTLEHCKNVSFLAFKICRALHLDYRCAARAGLLHDYYLYDWHCSPVKLHGYKHPQIALKNAKNDFELNKRECDIIKTHMWPLTLTKFPRYPESFIVGLADKIYTISEVAAGKIEKFIRSEE